MLPLAAASHLYMKRIATQRGIHILVSSLGQYAVHEDEDTACTITALTRVYTVYFKLCYKVGPRTYEAPLRERPAISNAAIYCLGEQLLKYKRRTNLSSVPSECRSGVRIHAEQQYRCMLSKVTVLLLFIN